MNTSSLPVAIIGAGPVGLAAAAHLIARGETPLILEAGPTVGAAMRHWGHVRLFSPWQYVVDQEAAKLLRATGWTDPDPEVLPTSQEIVASYLTPLAQVPSIAPHLWLNTRVVSVSRQGQDKLKTPGRETTPFVLTVVAPDGSEAQVLARAVIDASGTYASPNPLGANGVFALGERAAQDRITYGIPAVLGHDRARYAGKRVLVVGSGHSAFNVLLDLATLAEQEPATTIQWAIRRNAIGQLFGGGEGDALPARGQLGTRLQQVLATGAATLYAGIAIDTVTRTPTGVVVSSQDDVSPEVDEIIVTTGFRPDLALTRELRLDLDAATESPRALAPLIDPNVHSCGTVPPHGYEELKQPEPDFFIVGMKSYGRAPTFLMLTGYEQVRSIACALTGDLEGAREVHLVLPETGVCQAGDDGSCCATPVLPTFTVRAGKTLSVLSTSAHG